MVIRVAADIGKKGMSTRYKKTQMLRELLLRDS